MAARVRREAQITWAGETRAMVPDVAFLMAVEGQGISLLGMADDMRLRRLNMGQMSVLVAVTLSKAVTPEGSARWKVSPDDVLYRLGELGGLEMVTGVLGSLLEAVFPGDGKAQPGKTGPSGQVL